MKTRVIQTMHRFQYRGNFKYGRLHVQMIGNELAQKRRDLLTRMRQRYEMLRVEYERKQSA